MIKQNLGRTNQRVFWLTIGPAIALVVAAFAVAFYFVRPAPPDKIVMSTGTPDSGYQFFGLRYQEFLAPDGVTIELRTSAGSQQNVGRLLSLERAEAYTRRFPSLTKLNLPRGVFDFINNVPARDVTLVSPTANLLAKDNLHPALAFLLMRAASEIHSGCALLNKAGAFPAPLDAEFPLCEEAKRYYKTGPPFLQRYLPYWAAVLVDRLWITLLPALALLVPLMRIVPPVYRWRMRSRIYRKYALLKEVELELDENPTPEKLKNLLQRLDQLERAVNRIYTPLAYSDHLYIFRQHVNLVRQKVARALDAGD